MSTPSLYQFRPGPLAIHPPAIGHLVSRMQAAGRALADRAAPRAESLDDAREDLAWWSVQRRALQMDNTNGIAILDVRGILMPEETPFWTAVLGGTLYSELRADVDTILMRGIRGVLLTVDSPGGYCSGCTEAAEAISKLSQRLPVVAHVQNVCASAAYFLASGATEIWSDASADSGCIGVIIPMVDQSGAWEQMGIKDDYVTNTGGDLKATGYPPSQSAEERAQLQLEVDDMYAQFRDHVLAHRAIPAEAMRGQCAVGPRALESNLVDALGTRDQAMARLSALVRSRG
jgi:signal peptide peptidase SppA